MNPTPREIRRGDNDRTGSGLTAFAELLDVKAVAALLGGCSTRHVYRLSDSGRMPRPIHLGSLIRWRRAELLRWLNDGCPSEPREGCPQ